MIYVIDKINLTIDRLMYQMKTINKLCIYVV
jgi:hypothetical protein